MVPKLVFQALDIDLLSYGKGIKLYLLIKAASSVKSLRLLSLKHIFQVLDLFRIEEISLWLDVLFEADLNLVVLSHFLVSTLIF